MPTIEELNKYNDSGRMLSKEEITAEYTALYKKPPTPFTHPELFDPLNPPPGYEYDAWHAFWWKLPTKEQAMFDLWVMAVGTVVLLVWAGIVAYAK